MIGGNEIYVNILQSINDRKPWVERKNVGYMWDAKQRVYLMRQPSHSGGTQSVDLPFSLRNIKIRLQK
jgi:hypothetical protein